MKRIGILGGLGPESTVEYYQALIKLCMEKTGDGHYPEIIVNSVDMTEMLSFLEHGNLIGLADFLVDAIASLERSGANFAAIASNTPHIVIDEVKTRSQLPVLGIVDCVCERASNLGLQRLLLTGTGFTMASRFYPDFFQEKGISVLVPSQSEQNEIHSMIFPDLENGIVDPVKKVRFHSLCESIIQREHLDGLILGCTELPLIASPEDFSVPVLNTARIHIESIADFCCAD